MRLLYRPRTGRPVRVARALEQAAGIDVLRLTWRRLTAEPLAVVAEIATAPSAGGS